MPIERLAATGEECLVGGGHCRSASVLPQPVETPLPAPLTMEEAQQGSEGAVEARPTIWIEPFEEKKAKHLFQKVKKSSS